MGGPFPPRVLGSDLHSVCGAYLARKLSHRLGRLDRLHQSEAKLSRIRRMVHTRAFCISPLDHQLSCRAIVECSAGSAKGQSLAFLLLKVRWPYLHACPYTKVPIGVEHALSCLTVQLTRSLTFGVALCLSVCLQLWVWVCGCVGLHGRNQIRVR